MKPTYEEQMDYAKRLAKAVQGGRTEDVKTFLPFLSPTQGNRLLCYAVEDGYTDIVKVLIAATNPKENNSRALSIAARYGHTDLVKLLIPVSDPRILKAHHCLKQCIMDIQTVFGCLFLSQTFHWF